MLQFLFDGRRSPVECSDIQRPDAGFAFWLPVSTEYITGRRLSIQQLQVLFRADLAEKLLGAARRPEIDVVLVWRLDRWGRSVADLLATLPELDRLGVGFVSLTEALYLTTPAGRAMAHFSTPNPG